jgi:hypothetical protein
VGRVGVCMLCACDSEDREHGVGAGVNATMLSERIGIISLAESAARAFRLHSFSFSVTSFPLGSHFFLFCCK